MSVVKWKLEKDLCRCCHSEGVFKNLAEPSFKDGQEEIYCDMLQECLDINLTPVSGPLCAVTFTICEDCILRLREACSFKQQVTQCERRFRDLYSRDTIKLAACYEELAVKEEVPDQEDIDIHISRMDDDDDDDEDGLSLNYDDEDDNELLKIKEEEPKKPRPKRPKAKEKAKSKGPPGRPRKLKAEEPDKSTEDEKKGNNTQIENQFTLIEDAEGRLYSCNVCARVYTKRDLFTQHYRHVHLKLRPKLRSCHLCEVRVPGHKRARHLEEAHGVPRPICNACGKKFSYPFQVIHHQKQFHMDEKMYPCSQCDMKFTVPSRLRRHEAKHSSIRLYKCEYCEKAFKWKKNLKTHVMIHLDDKRQVCLICHEAFVQQTSLKYHIMKKHPGSV